MPCYKGPPAGDMCCTLLRHNVQRNANGHAKAAKVSGTVTDTGVRGLRYFHAETKSKPASSHEHGARKQPGILNISNPIAF